MANLFASETAMFSPIGVQIFELGTKDYPWGVLPRR